ncbi:hypothetical protein DFH11DRAFT_1631209 [Phellopilus nigrolimitatus]|nr:hypothetical protein DFH11DRAFT_1631209 [Phellopilus nigrolimitatus]
MIKRKINDGHDDAGLEEGMLTKRAKAAIENEDGAVVRRSSRIRTKKEANPESVSAQSEVDKRAKGKRTVKAPMDKRRRRSKVGRLEMLMRVPIDIFCEIATHLSPHDLLTMARASKSLRGLLMSKNSKPIWRAARESVELPECPTDLSEPKYADLIYCKGCYMCDTPRAQTLHFPLRLRLCKHCSEKYIVPRHRIRGYDIVGSEESVFNMVPYDQLYHFFSLDIKYHNVDEVKAVWEKYQSYELGSEERNRYVQRRKELVQEMSATSTKVLTWMSAQRREKEISQQANAKAREQSIREKLKELSYTDMDLDITLDSAALRSKWRKLVKEPKPITNRIWNNILPQLRKLIAERRVWREELEQAVMDDHDTDCSCSDCNFSDNEMYLGDEDFFFLTI